MSDDLAPNYYKPDPYTRTVVSGAAWEAAVAERSRQTAATVARRQQEDAEADAARERRARERGERELAAYEAETRAAYLRNGGTAHGWASTWPKLREQRLLELAAQGDPHERMIDQARQELRRQTEPLF